jgi:hypothetical protein
VSTVYDEEEWEFILHRFYNSVLDFVGQHANFETYEKMDDEKKRKLREKLTIMVCYEYSPRKTFDISKDTVRSMVEHAFEYWMMPVMPDE